MRNVSSWKMLFLHKQHSRMLHISLLTAGLFTFDELHDQIRFCIKFKTCSRCQISNKSCLCLSVRKMLCKVSFLTSFIKTKAKLSFVCRCRIEIWPAKVFRSRPWETSRLSSTAELTKKTSNKTRSCENMPPCANWQARMLCFLPQKQDVLSCRRKLLVNTP